MKSAASFLARSAFGGLAFIAIAIASLAAAETADPHLAKARTAIAGLGQGLKNELMAAMKSGGAVAAVQVCKTIAPAMATGRPTAAIVALRAPTATHNRSNTNKRPTAAFA
jgi:hypothetical protein